MDPEGTSHDDLDVRLDWPGAEPEGAADRQSIKRGNGADPSTARGHQSVPESSAVAPHPPVHVPQDLELETLRATLALMSTRLDALASAVEGARLSYNAVAASLERLERSVTLLTRTATDTSNRSAQATHDLGEAFSERLERIGQQLEALRRRIALRGRAEQTSSDEMIELIASAVVERLAERNKRSGEPPAASGRRRRGT